MQKIQLPPEVETGKTVFTILNGSGDDTLIWDPSDPKQIADAIDKFDEFMNNGYIAFLIDDDGQQGHQITKRDWEKLDVRQRGEILFKKDKSGKRKGQEVQVVPNLQAG